MGKEAVMLLRDAECSILLVWFSLRDGTSRTGRPLPQVMQSVFETMAQLTALDLPLLQGKTQQSVSVAQTWAR